MSSGINGVSSAPAIHAQSGAGAAQSSQLPKSAAQTPKKEAAPDSPSEKPHSEPKSVPEGKGKKLAEA